MIVAVRRGTFVAAPQNSAFSAGYGREALNGSSARCVDLTSRGWRSDVQRATRINELVSAASDGNSFAPSASIGGRDVANESQTRNASLKARAVRFAAGIALVAIGAPFPAAAQYFPPVMIIVPPAAQDYSKPRTTPKAPPDKPNSTADSPPPARPAGHYQGQTFVPD
jgi:hypothetical protein